MTPVPMMKAHKDPCENDQCPQTLCQHVRDNPELVEFVQTDHTIPAPENSNYEMMIAMPTGERKKRLLRVFDTLAQLDEPLSETQKNVIAAAMEVRRWSM